MKNHNNSYVHLCFFLFKPHCYEKLMLIVLVWNSWIQGECSTTCGSGMIRKQRSCVIPGKIPIPSSGCPGNSEEIEDCQNSHMCPKDNGSCLYNLICA